MKKALSIFFVLITVQIYGQALNKKWIEVIQLPGQKVYVDTSTIKKFENQISALSISTFSPAKFISGAGAEVSSIKSQILFDLATQKFTTIGTLYYDSKLKILAESSVPGYSLSGESFATPIDSSRAMAAVYVYCLNFINSGERIIENKDFGKLGDKTKLLTTNKLKNDSAEKTSILSKESHPEQNEIINQTLSAKPIKRDSSIKLIDQPADKKDNALNTLAAKKKNEDEGGVEVSPKSAIFKDGEKYSFQVSSWKNKSKADNEAARLKAQGHNVFIVDAYIPERGGTWYRVRIGYFNSLEETESYMKKLK